MNIRNLFKTKEVLAVDMEERYYSDYLTYNPVGGAYTLNKALLLSTVYRCVDVISDSVAQLPLEPYTVDAEGYKVRQLKHSLYYLLNKEPNSRMTRFSFMKSLIVSVLLKGNGYALINREGNTVKSLEILNPDSVSVSINKTGVLMYNIQGVKAPVESKDIIHILNFSYDGITGISTLHNARETLGLSSDSESHARGFFKGGANLAGILRIIGTSTEEQRRQMKTSWLSAFSPNTGSPNGIAVMQGNVEFQPITVNARDAQLLETRQFNVIDVCRFFGVSPIKAFDLTSANYSTVEATQLAFLTDTLAPLLQKIELEFERKLFKNTNIDLRFDTSVLLRADKAGQASYYSQLFNLGVMTTNEIRRELDLPAIEGGNEAFIQVNVQKLNNAGKEVPDVTENKQD